MDHFTLSWLPQSLHLGSIQPYIDSNRIQGHTVQFTKGVLVAQSSLSQLTGYRESAHPQAEAEIIG